MEHHFNIGLAKEYGIEEAILLHHFYYWIAKNAANNRHFHDGLYWTYNSKKAYAEIFPYINETKIARVIKHLEELGFIAKGNYSDDKWNRTNWYALTKKCIGILERYGYDSSVILPLVQNDTMDCVKMNNGLCQNEQSLLLINNTSNNNTDNNNKEEELKEKFALFIQLYKKLTGKRNRGLNTEFNAFKSKHKDWKTVIPYLSIAIKRETKEREQAKMLHKFFPEPKMLSTYLGKQRAWELYVTVGEDVEQIESTYTPQGRTIWFNEETQSYWSLDNFYDERIYDGYDDDNRPDGAEITLNNGRGTYKWNSNNKKWIKNG